MAKKYLVPVLTFGCALLCLLIGILTPIILGIIVKSEVTSQVELTRSNGKHKWGTIPGKLNILLEQQYSVFNLLNPEEVMKGAKPQVEEKKGYAYQEFDEFLEIKYGSSIEYFLWRYTLKTDRIKWPDDIKETDLITTVSVGALGGWDQVKHFNRQQLAIIGLYELILGLEYALPVIAYGLGMQPFLIDKNLTQVTIFDPAGISDEQGDAIWNDIRYGLGNRLGLQIWIIALQENLQNGTFVMPQPVVGTLYLLWQQFGLTSSQMTSIFTGHFYDIYDLISLVFFINYECPEYQGLDVCDPIFLAGIQWSSSGITLTPPAIPPLGPSILSINNTAAGYPELYYFYDYTTSKQKFSNYSFTPDTYRSLFNYNRTTGFPLYDPNTLLDVQQMSIFFQFGLNEDFSNMAQQFNLSDETAARILWDYVNALIDYTSLQGCFDPEVFDVGNRGIASEAAIGQVGSPSIYNFTVFLSETLLINITSLYDYLRFEELGLTCEEVVGDNIKQAGICGIYELQWQDGGISWWIQAYWDGVDSQAWRTFQITSGLSDVQMAELFGGQSTLVKNFAAFDLELKENYRCPNYGPHCDPHYLANKQWGQSYVTLNLPSIFNTLGHIENSTSISNYPFFSSKYSGTPEYGAFALALNKPVLANDTLIEELLSFTGLFAPTMFQRYFIYNFALNNSAITSEFGITDIDTFTAYLRYFVDRFFLGGLIRTKTVQQILYTDDDPLVHYQINLNPLKGGNPALSINQTQVAQNRSKEMVLEPGVQFYNKINSGRHNIDDLREYENYGGVDYFNFVQEYYFGVGNDGMPNISYINLNPWAVEVKTRGTDGWQFKPFLTSDDTLYYYLDISGVLFKINFYEHVTHKGYDCLKYEIDNGMLQNVTQNPKQADFYQFGPNGLTNETGVFAAPIFGSKPYFYQGEPNLYNMINFTNPDVSDKTCQSYFYIEKNTGLVVKGDEYVQYNLEIKPDILYPNLGLDNLKEFGYHTYLPFMILDRHVDIPKSELDKNLGMLKTVKKIELGGLIVGYTLAGIFSIFGGIVLWRRRKAKKVELNQESTNAAISLLQARN